MIFTKRILALVLAVIFSFGAVSVAAFAGLLSAAAEGKSTLGAAAACTGHTLGTFNGVPACVNSAGELHICENNFPDERFRRTIALSYEYVNDGDYLNVAQTNELNKIRCTAGLGILWIKGIEFFSNLSVLICSGNYISEIDLSRNSMLTELDCSENFITSLDVSNNIRITKLRCGTNRIKTLNLNKNTMLKSLDCSDNRLSKLDLSNNEKLESLNCAANQLTALCYNFHIQLVNRYCIMDVSLSLQQDILPDRDSSNERDSLGAIRCCENQRLGKFAGIPACVNNTGELHICDSNFPDEVFRDFLGEKKYDKNKNNHISSSEALQIKQIYSQNAYTIKRLDGIEFLSELKELTIYGSSITSLDLRNNKKLQYLNCDSNSLVSIDVSQCTALTNLSCDENWLDILDITNNKELVELNCSKNVLEELDLRNNTKLKYIDCSDNRLALLDIVNIADLTHLDCSKNHLTTLDVSAYTELESLYCGYNRLTEIDVSKNNKLKYLSVGGNQIAALDVSRNVELNYLACFSNKLSSLDVSRNIKLYQLFCQNNQLSSLDLSNNTEIKARSYGNQRIKLFLWPDIRTIDIREFVSERYLSNIGVGCSVAGVPNRSHNNHQEYVWYNYITGIIILEGRPDNFSYQYHFSENDFMDVTVDLCYHVHDFSEWELRRETSCVMAGEESRICLNSDCDEEEIRSIPLVPHAYGDYVSNVDDTHTHRCTFKSCNASETESCYGGTATCKDKAICKICGEAYGELDANNHTGEEVWEQTETTHTKKWNCCGKVTVAEADHKFENGVCTVCAYPCTHKDENTDHLCDICGKAITNHVDDDNNHVCDTCGKAVSNHVDYDNNHVCDICGKAVTNHVDDDNNHVCDICGKAVTNHVDDDNNHVCDICGKAITNHVDENNNHVCDICGKAITNHVDSNNNHICDICGKAITNHVDENNNHVCDICGKTVSNHVDSNNDHLCDTCGKAVSNHVDENNNHVCDICGKTVSNHVDSNNDHICDICGETISTHTGGTATCKDKAVCEICGEAYGELNPENHTGGTHLEHEKSATCTEKGYTGDTYCSGCNEKIADGSEIPTKPHTPGEKWVIENGKKVKKCTECGTVVDTLKRLPGDVDGDGEITMLDCLYLKRYILGTYNGEIVLENADVDGNGRIDATDYLYLKRGYLGTFDLSKFA